MKRNKYMRPKRLQEQGEAGEDRANKPRLKTSAMIASIAGEGQRRSRRRSGMRSPRSLKPDPRSSA